MIVGAPWLLLPLSGVLLFIIVVRPLEFFPEDRWRTMALASWFALTALVLLAATDVVAASLGLGDWTSHGLGGVEPLPQPQPTGVRIEGGGAAPPWYYTGWRTGWGWGAGLAWWATVVGLTACLIDLGGAMLAMRRQRRITASASPGPA
jgi:hypothetical protein